MYSREFIALNVGYAQIAAEKIGVGFIEAVAILTCIRRTVLRAGFGNDVSSENLWREFVSKPGDDPVGTVMRLQDRVPPKERKENRIRSGRLSATLPNDHGLSLIHFSEDQSEPNPLGEDGLKKLIAEMTILLNLLKKSGPMNIGMFSWLLDGSFATLFPGETDYINNPDAFYQSLAVWGQYLRFNGSINQYRATQLMENVKKTTQLTEMQLAHPKRALVARVPAGKMFLMYGIN